MLNRSIILHVLCSVIMFPQIQYELLLKKLKTTKMGIMKDLIPIDGEEVSRKFLDTLENDKTFRIIDAFNNLENLYVNTGG